MSKKIVQDILLKAQKDTIFMQKLLHDPKATLAGYSLSKTEQEFFATADEKTIRGLSPACFELADQAKKTK